MILFFVLLVLFVSFILPPQNLRSLLKRTREIRPCKIKAGRRRFKRPGSSDLSDTDCTTGLHHGL